MAAYRARQPWSVQEPHAVPSLLGTESHPVSLHMASVLERLGREGRLVRGGPGTGTCPARGTWSVLRIAFESET